jgi:hypothetical protein
VPFLHQKKLIVRCWCSDGSGYRLNIRSGWRRNGGCRSLRQRRNRTWNLAHLCLWEDPSLHSRKLLLQCYADAGYLSDIHNGIQPFNFMEIICETNHNSNIIKSWWTLSTTGGESRMCFVKVSNSTHTSDLWFIYQENKCDNYLWIYYCIYCLVEMLH